MASSECTALAALATSLNLPLAARNDAPTASCCQWKGLDCTTSGQVRGIVWSSSSLTGSIPAAVKDLAHLELLDLSSNQITGSIPAELGSIASLRSLNLANNQLNGALPSTLSGLANLQSLRLDSNSFSGALPALPSSLATCTLGGGANTFSCTSLSASSACASSISTSLPTCSATPTSPASTFWTRDMIIIVASCSVAAVAIVSMFVTLFCWERNKRKAAKEQAILERQLYEQFDAGVAASHAANRVAPPNSAPNSQLGVSPHMTPMSMATTPVQEPRYSVVIDPYAKFYNGGVAANGGDGSNRTSNYSNGASPAFGASSSSVASPTLLGTPGTPTTGPWHVTPGEYSPNVAAANNALVAAAAAEAADRSRRTAVHPRPVSMPTALHSGRSSPPPQPPAQRRAGGGHAQRTAPFPDSDDAFRRRSAHLAASIVGAMDAWFGRSGGGSAGSRSSGIATSSGGSPAATRRAPPPPPLSGIDVVCPDDARAPMLMHIPPPTEMDTMAAPGARGSYMGTLSLPPVTLPRRGSTASVGAADAGPVATGTPPPTPDRWEWHRTSYLPPAVSHAVNPEAAAQEHVAPLPPGWDVERARNAPPRAPSYAVS
ncbi:hypothetical protein AMAG_02928 [Allomyces macrogynus ATCC 38327]|uniref:Leucine-rich repeat-containing N-terminal plant-type domain-containing protein n=1 Tax=Allomyces macrogynus (strain ATCC 38327) TaxID=578462 RepID=A0A0L0S3P8_ALLM3|nr:hypothetical protein AMAG_02928 [Allomyces macrogynus ATCC 38327]|eukprot:KNE57183.1 hypothetical protein AMAG_02928 [Allomyces macrogynus ATCC 38327]